MKMALAAGALVAVSGLAAAPAQVVAQVRCRPRANPRSRSIRDRSAEDARLAGYNNYYEFGTSKDDPARHAGWLT
jgi:hypothetical protein